MEPYLEVFLVTDEEIEAIEIHDSYLELQADCDRDEEA